ncbi:uncharacterized protein LOC118437083 [Folsomia candida]|nr:uncharacterized protein LOC118437083 [Folsomia candida]
MLAPKDAFFSSDRIHTCTRNSLVVSIELKGQIDPNHIRKLLNTKILQSRDQNGNLLYPEIGWSMRHWLGFPFWSQASLIEDNVRVSSEDVDLKQLQAQLAVQEYRENAPLWELVLHTNCVLLRWHHSLSDGYGMLLLHEELRTLGTAKKLRPVVPSRKSIGTSFLPYLALPYDLIKLFVELLLTEWFPLDKKSWTKFNAKSSPLETSARLCSHTSEAIPFSVIRKLGVKFGVNGTAVLHSAILGGLRTFFLANGRNIPSSVAVETPIPESVERKRRLGNNVTLRCYSAPLGSLDAQTRLRLVHSGILSMKRSTFPLAMTLAVAALGHLPRTLLRFTFAANDKRQRIFISNLAGFEEATDFCGHQVENISMAAGIYVGNAGIGITLISSGGELRVTVLADRNILHDDLCALRVTENFMAELDLLRAACPDGNKDDTFTI